MSQNLEEARDFLGELAEQPPRLPYEPTLLPSLFAATREQSTASVADLTALIERSQKLAARVLTIANSSCYALESTVTSLSRAVSVLGFQEVRSLVMMVSAASAIKGAKLPSEFNASGLWKHQLQTACMAKAMTRAIKNNPATKTTLSIEPDEAYAAGLLHDIGKVFLATSRPAIWAKIEEIRLDKKISFADAEATYWGMEHGLVGAQVLHYWKLPLLLTDTINWHHAPFLAPSYQAEASVLAAANELAHTDFATNPTLPESVVELLPPHTDTRYVITAVQEELACNKTETLAGMVN